MSRIETEADALAADGVIAAVQPGVGRDVWGADLAEFFAIGAAVASIRVDQEITPPQMVLSLNG